MTDREILDWLESRQCEVRYREYLPDGRRTNRPWWVCESGHVPFTGRTLRLAARGSARSSPGRY
jgi:hypothetical protein